MSTVHDVLVSNCRSARPRLQHLIRSGEHFVRAMIGHAIQYIDYEEIYGHLSEAAFHEMGIEWAVHGTRRSLVQRILSGRFLPVGGTTHGRVATHMLPVY